MALKDAPDSLSLYGEALKKGSASQWDPAIGEILKALWRELALSHESPLVDALCQGKAPIARIARVFAQMLENYTGENRMESYFAPSSPFALAEGAEKEELQTRVKAGAVRLKAMLKLEPGMDSLSLYTRGVRADPDLISQPLCEEILDAAGRELIKGRESALASAFCESRTPLTGFARSLLDMAEAILSKRGSYNFHPHPLERIYGEEATSLIRSLRDVLTRMRGLPKKNGRAEAASPKGGQEEAGQAAFASSGDSRFEDSDEGGKKLEDWELNLKEANKRLYVEKLGLEQSVESLKEELAECRRMLEDREAATDYGPQLERLTAEVGALKREVAGLKLQLRQQRLVKKLEQDKLGLLI